MSWKLEKRKEHDGRSDSESDSDSESEADADADAELSQRCPEVRALSEDVVFYGKLGVRSQNSCVSIDFNVAIPIHLGSNS